MSKSRRNRKKKNKRKVNNGTGTPLGGANKQARAARESRSIALLQTLASTSVEERKQACIAISSMFQGDDYEPDVLSVLLKHKVFRKLNTAVCDADAEVRALACSALHNISASCGSRVRDEMNKSDVTTTAFHFLKSSKNDGTDVEALTYCLKLLCNIFENSDRIVDMESDENLNCVLMSLDIQKNGNDKNDLKENQIILRNEAARLLHIATDTNYVLAKKFDANPPVLERLVSIIINENHDIITRLHICGTLVNVSLSIENVAKTCTVVLPILSSKYVLHENCNYASQIPTIIASSESNNSEELETWKSAVDAQLLGLEVLTNLACADVPDEVDPEQYIKDYEKIIQLILDSGAMLRVETVLTSSGRFLEELKQNSVLTDNVIQLGQRAAGCLDNLIQNMPLQSFNNSDSVWNLTYKVIALLRTRNEEGDLDFLETSTALAWSVFRRLKEKASSLNGIPDAQVFGIIDLSTSPTSPIVRSNAVGILGELCQIGLDSNDRNDNILTAVINSTCNCLNDNAISVVVQTIEVIFGIFGDETRDELFVKLKLLPILRTLLPRLKSRAQDMNNLKTLRMDPEALHDAIVNLDAFITFKEEELKK